MKYIIMDFKDGGFFSDEFSTKEEALQEAEEQWKQLTEYDQRHRKAFYVLENINPDEDASDHYDGNIVKRWK